jgi:DNA ligase-associated metallophosphoesterase
MITIFWNQHEFILCPEKAVYWPSQETIFVADTHFGKAASFWKMGIPVPGNNTEEDCDRLGKLVQNSGAQSLVFLGDFLHAKVSKTETVREVLLQFRKNFPELKLHLVRGNHDLHSGDPWQELEIECHSDPWKLENFDCRHIPIERTIRPYLAGHTHPSYRLFGKGQNSISSPCFVVSPDKIILPAFGSFTGTMKVNKQVDENIYVTDGIEVIQV